MENKYHKIFLNNKRILITGGAGFIGGALIRNLLKFTNSTIFNLDKISYCSDLTSINDCLRSNKELKERYFFLKVDLRDFNKLEEVLEYSNPDIIFHLAAESHVDKSIQNPRVFIENNIIGSLNIIEQSLRHYNQLNSLRKDKFKFIHLSTDEVFGSLLEGFYFDEKSNYNPSSPYSASKACCDFLVNAWTKTYELPTINVNCTNNYGPWQFPEKLIPLAFMKAIKGESIPLYGDGSNFRDWLFVDDNIDALISIALYGKLGVSYLIGCKTQISNNDVILKICNFLNYHMPRNYNYQSLIKNVEDRPGHDFGYSIDPKKIKNELNWSPKYDFDKGLEETLKWYLKNISWCEKVLSYSLSNPN